MSNKLRIETLRAQRQDIASRWIGLGVDKRATQSELAERLGVHQVTLANWEIGKHKPHRVFLRKLKEILDSLEREVQKAEGRQTPAMIASKVPRGPVVE